MASGRVPNIVIIFMFLNRFLLCADSRERISFSEQELPVLQAGNAKKRIVSACMNAAVR